MRTTHCLLAIGAFVPAVAQAKGADWKGTSGYAMMQVEAGAFTMGSPLTEPGRGDDEESHEVTFTTGFLMGRTEVTQGLWRSVIGGNPSVTEFRGLTLLGDELPVQNVSWCEAVVFANELSVRDGLTPAYAEVEKCRTLGHTAVKWDRSSDGYRLPTEAEWEYAARAGQVGPYAGGASEADACGVGNVADESARFHFVQWKAFECNDGVVGLSPVGHFPANPWGLRDMTGNVWEWCWDIHGAYGGPTTVPMGEEVGNQRIYRGGSWVNQPGPARVASRNKQRPDFRSYSLGFRLVRTVS